MVPTSSLYPVSLDLEAPLKVARWRPLVHWLMAIPHLIVLYVLILVLDVLTFVSFFAILFTGRIPRGLFDFIVTTHRYQWRVTSFELFMREPYPPFDLAASALDPGNDPAQFSIVYPERLSRLLIFVKWLLAIPHYIVLVLLLIGAYVVIIIGFFAVLILGRWPEGLRNYLVGTYRWLSRVQAYVSLLTDVYPPFSLAP